MKTLSSVQQKIAILDFLTYARANSISGLSAYLPARHPALGGVKQIRVLKDVLAIGYDELGNRICLTLAGKVVQLFEGEKV